MSIADLGGKRYRKQIRTQLGKEQNPLAEVGLMDALYRLGERDVYERLAGKLSSDSYLIRCAAANRLRDLDLEPSTRRVALSMLKRAKRHPIGKADLEAVGRALRCLSTTR